MEGTWDRRERAPGIVASVSRDGSRPMPPGGSPYGRGIQGGGVSFQPDIHRWRSVTRENPSVDPESNNLHAGVGERCLICDKKIKQGQQVRRTISGGFVHDNC